jgi:hypothetical protein
MSDPRPAPIQPEPNSRATSTCDVTPSDAANNDGRSGAIDGPADESPEDKARPEDERAEPESRTQRWKRQVEAEARSRLKKNIRDLGSARRG